MNTKPAKPAKKIDSTIRIVDFDTAREAIKGAFGGDTLRVTFKDVTGKKLNQIQKSRRTKSIH